MEKTNISLASSDKTEKYIKEFYHNIILSCLFTRKGGFVMTYKNANATMEEINGKLEDLYNLQRETHSEEIKDGIQNIIDRFERKIERVEKRKGKSVDRKVNSLVEHLDREISNYSSNSESDGTEGDYESGSSQGETQNGSGDGLLSSLYSGVKGALLGAAAVAVLGYVANTGIALRDDLSPYERLSPMKRVVVESGQTPGEIARGFGVPLDMLVSAYESKLGREFNPRTDLQVGDEISAVGYGRTSLVGINRD